MTQTAPAYQRDMRIDPMPVDPHGSRYRADPMDSYAYVLGANGEFQEVAASGPFPFPAAAPLA